MKTADEIRKLSLEEIITEIQLTKREIIAMRFKISSGQEKNTSKAKKIKRYLARLNFILGEKNMEVGIEETQKEAVSTI